MRLAARPVGAASAISPWTLSSLMMHLMIVVLPVPGPPVMTVMPLVTAVFDGLPLLGVKGNALHALQLVDLRGQVGRHRIRHGVDHLPAGGARPRFRRDRSRADRARRRPLRFRPAESARRFRARESGCRWCARSNQGRCRGCAARLKRAPAGKKQCPATAVASESVYFTPALRRYSLSCSMPSEAAMRSAVLKPMPSTSSTRR